MNMKKILLVVILAVSTLSIFAQEQRIKEPGQTLFKPHWYIQLQGGAAHTLGEAKFGDLISPAAALNVGYKFAPVLGVRVGASGWQAKGGWVSPKQDYKFKYIQGNVDLVLDLSTLFCGFNPDRVFNGYVFGGGAFNHAFDNDEANALNTNDYVMEYLWSGSKNTIAGRFGLGADFRLSDYFAINLEANANVMNDKFNSKKAGNSDWQFNALIGFKVNLGKSYKKTEPVYYEPTPRPEPKPEPKPEPRPEPKPAPPVEIVIEALQQDVFFAINSAKIQDDQQRKITELVNYLEKYPESKVNITGYADVNTGNANINSRLSKQRANNVADALKAKGISADRIVIDFKGDTVQPYNTPEKNRVSICIAE